MADEATEAPAFVPMTEGQIQLARRVAADAWEATGCKGESRKKFDAAILKDTRLDNCEKSEIDAVVERAGECFAYWKAKGIERPTSTIDAIPHEAGEAGVNPVEVVALPKAQTVAGVPMVAESVEQ